MAFERTVVESHVAQRTVDAEIKWEPALADLYDGLKWRLARQPEVGYPIPRTNPPAYVIHSFHWKGLRGALPIVVSYTFDADQVVIYGVRVLRTIH
jgi:hypothetical protein